MFVFAYFIFTPVIVLPYDIRLWVLIFHNAHFYLVFSHCTSQQYGHLLSL